MKLTIPEMSLVVLIGASGAGKSTFAREHFRPTEVLSSDFCRGLVADDENDQRATPDAFDLLHYIARKRLAAGRVTVVDATNVQPAARKPLVALAAEYHCLPVAIVFDLPEKLCHERNRTRPDRDFGPQVIRRHVGDLRGEGFRYIYTLRSPAEVDAATIERQPLWNNRRDDRGPFDIVGDVHGCFDELAGLLAALGYQVAASTDADGQPHYTLSHPAGRKLVFVGDLADRGPRIADVLRLAMDTVAEGSALCIAGNHESKLLRKLQGRDVQLTHGLAESVAQLAAEPPAFSQRVAAFLDGLVGHYVLDDGRLVVAHAGLKETMHGRASRAVREFALYGETTGETDEFGLPVRYNWAADYRGRAAVVYGHTPVPEAEWLNDTINVDTGCVFGGRLTALRWPERELVSVPAGHTYYAPARPFLPAAEQAPRFTAQQQHDDLLDLGDVLGKRIVETRLVRAITVGEEYASAALEVMSRYAVDPRWLIYLPPTMSPCATSQLPGLLEHPAEAFAYYRAEGVAQVVCEEKHMGSRAVLVICRDADVARRRFGLDDELAGTCYTRTGRPFFDDTALAAGLIGRVRAALAAGEFWARLDTDWVCLDAELMPWSAKAQGLLRGQYAATGAAARGAFAAALSLLERAAARDASAAPLLARWQERAVMASDYVDAYRRYCWAVTTLDDLKLAPFHVLATEGAVHHDRDHLWHLATLAPLAASDPGLFVATAHQAVDLADPASEEAATAWWAALTASGGEGMVVKPLAFVTRGRRGVVQPAVKCRGREYLRLIYGPEYTAPANLERLRQRGLSGKRGLAAREFALGLEALERFVRREPLRRVHECAFAVLALESTPVDPRL